MKKGDAASRFIPATAGNTLLRLPITKSLSVYPRYRGEHTDKRAIGSISSGLSPLPRGTRFCRKLYCAFRRFIPATAGNTATAQRIPTPISVYPRYRGEHFWLAVITRRMAGLSPLPRGTLLAGSHHTTDGRFIPATAGNTAEPDGRLRDRPVYPRYRGEHALTPDCSVFHSGLSPLPRGTLFLFIVRNEQGRFIPATAGNTCIPRYVLVRFAVYPRYRGEHSPFVTQ